MDTKGKSIGFTKISELKYEIQKFIHTAHNLKKMNQNPDIQRQILRNNPELTNWQQKER